MRTTTTVLVATTSGGPTGRRVPGAGTRQMGGAAR